MKAVGFIWNSIYGLREIVRVATHTGSGAPVYFVATDGNPVLQLILDSEIDAEIYRDERNFAGRKNVVAARQQDTQAQAQHDSWYGFIDQIRSPTGKRRAIATLNKQVHVRSAFAERGAHILTLVREGYVVGGADGLMGRFLQEPNGLFFLEKDLTKIGLDFAEYLTRTGAA